MNKIAPLEGENSALSLVAFPKKVKIEPQANGQPVRVCKICLEEQVLSIDVLENMTEQEFKELRLIVPCECSGSMGYVHQKCIRTWIQKQLSQLQQKRIFCQICKAPIFFKLKKTKQWDCRLQNILNISCCNVISSIMELLLLVVVILVFLYSESISNYSFVKYILMSLIAVLSLTFLLTIAVMISEAFVKKIKFIEKIYSLEESEQMGLRQTKRISVREVVTAKKLTRRKRKDKRQHASGEQQTSNFHHPIVPVVSYE